MVEAAPSSVDLQDFQFKLHSKLKVFDNADDSKFKNAFSLVSAASRYGLIFIGSPSAILEVVQLNTVENSNFTKVESSDFAKRSFPLPSIPSHLALNCDQTLLAVVCNKSDCAVAIIYNVASFLSQNVAVVREIRVSATPGVAVLETCWNPAMPTVYTACKADGSLGVYNIQENSVDINELPIAAAARCFCWSPKGKQLVVGATNGSLTQYKPDLKAVKAIQTPALTGQGPFPVVNVFWLTNYQFVAVYKDAGDDEARPMILIVNAPKAGAITFINYEDICYSNGNLRFQQYYIVHQPTWGVLLIASANSMEVGVLGISQSGEPALWQQWNQIDAARAELPLSTKHQETFPVGFAFDTGVTLQLPWGENQSLPPMPMIHVLSHHGVLCSYSVINIRQGVATLCTPPEPVPDQSGLNQFVVQKIAMPAPVPAVPVPTQATPTLLSALQQPLIKAEVPQQTGTLFGLPAASVAPSTPENLIKPTAQQSTLFGGGALSSPQPGALFGGAIATAAPPTTPLGSCSMFGGGTLFGDTPNFNIAATQAVPATGGNSLNFKLPTSSAAPNFGGSLSTANNSTPIGLSTSTTSPSFGAQSSSLFGGLAINAPVSSTGTSPAPPPAYGTQNSSLFGGLATTSAPNFGTPPNKSMFNLPMTPNPNFGSLNVTQKTSTPTLATTTAVSLVIPTPNLSTSISSPTQQNNTMFNSPRSTGQPLLATPKYSAPANVTTPQPRTPDVINNSQPEISATQPTTPNNDSLSTKKVESIISDDLIHELIKEEVKNFHSELQELFYRCKNIKLDVGTEEEKSHLVLSTESLMEFYKKLQDITDSQVAEIYYLKQAVMQSFAWYEDTKARHKRYTDPHFSSLLQSQELDPISEKQLADIKHLFYYIEAQLKQVDSFLDNQWGDFQDSCKKHIKGKLHIPTLEPVYQSLVRQNAILERQKYLLKDIVARIKSRNKKVSNFPHVMNILNLKNDNDNIEIDEELRKLKIDNGDIFAVRYDKIVANEKKFTANKQSKLCSFFTNRNVVHIAPKKPKFVNNLLVNTPTKLGSSFSSSPGFRRILRTAFDNLEQSKLDASPAEANLSSSNLFSFTLLDGAHSTKMRTPEKNTTIPQNVATLSYNTPKSAETQPIKPVASSPAQISKLQSKFFNLAPGTPVTNTSIFNFTASSTAVTQTKSHIFTSNTNIQSPGSSSFNNSKIISSLPENTKPSQSHFSFFTPASSAAQIVNSPKAVEPLSLIKEALPSSKPNLAQSEVTLIKPNVVKSSASDTAVVGLSSPEVKTSQPFAFIVPQPKSASVFKEASVAPTVAASVPKPSQSIFKAAGDSFAQPRDSLESGFNFGSALSLGQQSTPKPKTVASTMNFGQMLGQVSTTNATSVNLTKPVSTIAAVSITTVASQSSTFKPAFSVASILSTASSPQISINPVSIAVAPTAPASAPAASITITPVSKIEPVSVATTTSTTSIFGGNAANKTMTSAAPIFGQQSTIPASAANVSGTNSIFGVGQTLNSGSIFGGKSTTPVQPSLSLFNVKSTAATSPSASISPATPNSATPTATTGFSFTQTAATAAVSTPEPTNTSSIFGGAGSTSPNTIFGGATATTTSATDFSFLQQSASTPASSEAPKAASVFNLPAGSTTTAFGMAPKSTQSSSFGFDSLAVTSTASATSPENKFSFGNLTVSALSPNAITTTTVTTANTSSFSFALPASTSAATTTTATPGFGGFGSNMFNKPATTTTASTFIGQPICSPSSFSQNRGSIFGQAAGNVFAQKPTQPNTAATGSMFAQSGGSIFGQNSTTAVTSATSIFGQTQSSPFGSPVTTSTTGSIFGQSSAFGATPAATTAGSVFGQNTFGSPAATSAPGSFSFTQNTGATAGFGSSGGSIFGAKPSFGQSAAFGQPPAFGSAPAFGAAPAGPNVFGSPAPASPTGSFGGGFGSPPAFGQKPPAFGSPPNFGQNTFGSPPAFGSNPSFGSPQRVFGATASPPTSSFGAPVQENSTFANLANQPTLGFGNLAQNQTPAASPQQPQFSGGAQFSSWR